MSSPLSHENMPTIVSVCFILVLLSLAMNFYNYGQINEAVGATGLLAVDAAQRDDVVRRDLEKQVKALSAQVEELKAQAGSAEAAAPASAEAE